MAVTETSISELLDQLDTRSIEDGNYKWTSEPIEPLTTYNISSGGTFSPSYGAVPNVTIGNGGTGINVSPTVWTTATAGQTWTTTTNNTGAYTFANQNIQPNNTVHIQGEDADLLINNKSLKTWMERVEERLNILTPNPELEKEWDQLRRLGERYRKLEKKCQEKAAMWKQLKSMPAPNIK
jgi:hypothetical protein